MKNVEEVKLISFNKPTGIGDWHQKLKLVYVYQYDILVLELNPPMAFSRGYKITFDQLNPFKLL